MTDKSQLDKFKEAASEAECDMDEAVFDRALGKIAKAEKKPELDNDSKSDQAHSDS